jgi:hypothetical protein
MFIFSLYLFSFVYSSEINIQYKNKEDVFINSLKGYTFYKGLISFKGFDIQLSEEYRNIEYKNSENIFYYPVEKKDTVLFFIEAVILGIPRDLDFLSENRRTLDKSILILISKLKIEEYPINFFKYKEIYSLRGKSVYQLEFNFNLDGKINVYFLTLNNRTGPWRIESISIKRPFLTSR